MDKRYFLIFFILVISLASLYMISSGSDIVGSASVNVGNYTMSLPNGFSLYDLKDTNVLIINPNSKMYITIYTALNSKDNYQNKYSEIEKGDYKILSNGTINVKGTLVNSIYYQSLKNSNNRSTYYFDKEGSSFRILIEGFNYDAQKDETIFIVSDIISSIRVNYRT